MPREQRTEVLVVGAGPVGMLTALLLSRGGVKVRIIDQDWRTASRTYSCALHPRTLKLLSAVGLTREVLAVGQQVSRVAFYEGENRRAEVKMSALAADFPFVLVLAQSAFEKLLEEKLKENHITVEWNHQLSGLHVNGQSPMGVVDKLGVSAKGFIVPEMDWSVEETHEVRADYVVGADGPNSFVAHCLAINYEKAGAAECFAVYEFASDWKVDDELRVALSAQGTNVLWPLPAKKFRWSFQLPHEHQPDFPTKERKSLVINEPRSDRAHQDFAEKFVRERARWFTGSLKEIGWSTEVEFQRRLAPRFGQGPCWLVGDAAHQTGPAGMQSMNMGLFEAELLARAIVQISKEKASTELLEVYNETARQEWQTLLGAERVVQADIKADPWVREHRAQILSSLPACGDDLRELLKQLSLSVSPAQ